MRNELITYLVIAVVNTACAVDPADPRAVGQSNYGAHFILGFTQQHLRDIRHGFNEISITAQCDASITITSLLSKNPLQSIFLKAGKVFQFKVSSSFRMDGTGVENKGVQIQSTANIAVIGINYVPGTSGAFLALPTSALGKTYVVSTRINLGYPLSQKLANFGVISQRDGTKVSITLKTNGTVSYLNSTYGVGETFTVTLNKLETFHLTHDYDLSGTIINSNYPVAVLSGSPCENVGNSGYCDHLVSFLLPIEKWGEEYILVPAMKSKTCGNFYRVFASQKTLVKSRNGTRVINRGDFLEIGPCYNELLSFVSCSKPCQVVQYVRPYEPSSIVLPSTEQFGTSYKVVPLAKSYFAHHIIIIIEEQHKGALTVTEQRNAQFNWQKVNGTKYVWATYNITRVTDIASSNDVKFGVIVSGSSRNRESYGYPAGFTFTQYTDIDECKNPSLYLCHSGFECVNTLSSYECVCNGRITNGKCEDEGYTRYRLNLRLKEEYTNALSNNASQEFKAIETRIINAMAKVYENNDAYDGIEVKKMKNGSVIAEMELIFTDKNTKGISELLEVVRNNSFGDFDVDPNALTVVITGTCKSQQCPGNSTCKPLTADTISCPCNDGYYYDGVSCKEFIVIKVEVTLEKEFTEELNNKSSPVYQELERNITAELYETFKNTPNFQEVVVLGFRNGSVIVDFKVVYRKDKNNKKIVVAETVREQIVKTRKLGNYQVKSAVVQGPPPPPAGLKETGKTDTNIDIRWEKPKGHSAFDIDGYMVSHKTDAETKYKNQMISATSGVLNVVLTGLESDTIYEITVHAYNDDGDGDKLKIQVKTEKPDDSTTVVIVVVVVVIAIVLLLIVAMVVFFFLRKRRHRYETRRAAYANRSKEGPVTMDLATMPYKSTNYDNYGQTDEEASTSQKL